MQEDVDSILALSTALGLARRSMDRHGFLPDTIILAQNDSDRFEIQTTAQGDEATQFFAALTAAFFHLRCRDYVLVNWAPLDSSDQPGLSVIQGRAGFPPVRMDFSVEWGPNRLVRSIRQIGTDSVSENDPGHLFKMPKTSIADAIEHLFDCLAQREQYLFSPNFEKIFYQPTLKLIGGTA